MSHEGLGRILVGLGLLTALIGAGVWCFGNKLGGIGRLPGDIVIERENFRFYFPLTTLVLINGVIWVVIKLVGAFQK